ncbi:MAG: Fe2+-dependent dioxygenase [Myxococcota bacterium]
MAFFIDDVLDTHMLDTIVEALQDERLFEDGASTAGGAARAVKNNEQARPTEDIVRGATKLLKKALLKNSDFKATALPKEIIRLSFSRYIKGMQYGAHVDDAFIGGLRTDLSFTLFLSEPDSYGGGELVIQRYDGDEKIKLPKGSLYLYPSDTLHRVAPVEFGTRLAAVGWVHSRVRADEQRTVLFDLDRALRKLPRNTETHETRLILLRSRNSLLRMWAD